MPAQQRLGADQMQRVAPSISQPRQDEQEQAIVVSQARPTDLAAQHDDLLAEQRLLGQELRTRASEISSGTERQPRHRSGRSEQAPEQPVEGNEQCGDRLQVQLAPAKGNTEGELVGKPVQPGPVKSQREHRPTRCRPSAHGHRSALNSWRMPTEASTGRWEPQRQSNDDDVGAVVG